MWGVLLSWGYYYGYEAIQKTWNRIRDFMEGSHRGVLVKESMFLIRVQGNDMARKNESSGG